MQIFMLAFITLLVAGSLLTPVIQHNMDSQQNVTSVMGQVNEYQMFMFVANNYMAKYSGGPGDVTWDMMKTASGAPSGAANATMPSNWKVHVAADMSWVTCTQMDERALGIIQQLVTPNGMSLNSTQQNNQQYVVVGASTDLGKASQCM